MPSLFLRVLLRMLFTVMDVCHITSGVIRRWTCRLDGRIRPMAGATRTNRLVARGDLGQTTAEYGLVILAAGSLALAAILWARSSGSITGLFENVIERLTGSL